MLAVKYGIEVLTCGEKDFTVGLCAKVDRCYYYEYEGGENFCQDLYHL
jgi:hypothetical protein